jgi:hypothetical protein
MAIICARLNTCLNGLGRRFGLPRLAVKSSILAIRWWRERPASFVVSNGMTGWLDSTLPIVQSMCFHSLKKKHPNDGRPRAAIEAARRFANGEIDAAAWAAIGAAAWAAIGAAAAGAAARAAAREEERRWQIKKLQKYLGK